MNYITDTQGRDLATLGQILAQRPELERFLKHAKQLQQDYRDGKLSIPPELDFTEYDEETAAAAAALVIAIMGVDG